MKRAVVVRRSRNVMDVACTTHCYVNYIKSGEKPSKRTETYVNMNKKWGRSNSKSLSAKTLTQKEKESYEGICFNGSINK